MKPFSWPIRVYYEDTDSGGVVYHANYLNFMERARTEWLRNMGVEQDNLRDEQGVLFAVHSMKINYRSPAKFNDMLSVNCELIKAQGASLHFQHGVLRNGELLSDATVRVACLDAKSFRPKSIPESILMEIKSDC